MKTVRKITGGTAATLLLGATIAVATPLSAQAAEAAQAPAAGPSTAVGTYARYGPYETEGVCNYWRAQFPGPKSECILAIDGWAFTAP